MEIKWRLVEICLHFSTLAAKINAECTFISPLLGRHFKGTLNGNTAHGAGPLKRSGEEKDASRSTRSDLNASESIRFASFLCPVDNHKTAILVQIL